mgnify:FL=1
MSRNSQSMSPVQKQALLVCAVCALAILITASVTYVLLATKGGTSSSSSIPQVEEPDDLATHYQVNTQSAALLTETADAGEAYLNDTLFLGDSNTVRLYNNGLITLQQFCAKEGIGIQTALSEPLVTFRGTDQRYTMAQAVAMMKPRRVVITLGTNDNGMEVETFIGYYTQLVQEIQASYPYTDIIVNTVPPVPQDHSNYPSTSQEKIDDFNMALLTMCENLGVKFLNSAEVLKDPATGFGQDDYYISGDIHLKSSGLKAMLNYLTTHAYETEDRRPDTSNIPTRTLEYTSNPSDPVAAPSSSSSEAAGEAFEARYRIDQTGGTLTSGDTSGETSLRFDVTGEQSVTVTAVPDDGYFFVNWSDGVTSRTRTDSNFKQNLDVTAVFSRASVEIAGEGSGLLGMNYTFTARLSGQYAKAENLHWYVNGVESKEAAGRTSVSFIVDPLLANQAYTVYAAVTYNDSQVVSNTLTVSFESGIGTGSSSSSSSSSSSASGSSSSGSSSSSASGSEVEDPSEEVSASSSSSSSSSSGSSGSSSGAGSSSSRPSSSGSSDASSSSSSHAGSSSSSSSRPSSSEAGNAGSSSSQASSGSSSSSHASSSSSHASSVKDESEPEEDGKPASSSSRPSSSSSSASRGEEEDSTINDQFVDGLFGIVD